MIVMRADDDVFVGFAGQVGGDVVDDFRFGADVDREVDREIREGEGVGTAVLIDLLRNCVEVLACGLRPIVGGFGLDANEEDSGVFGTGGIGKFAEVVGSALMMSRV